MLSENVTYLQRQIGERERKSSLYLKLSIHSGYAVKIKPKTMNVNKCKSKVEVCSI